MDGLHPKSTVCKSNLFLKYKKLAWKWKCQSFSHVQLWNPMDCSPSGSSVHGFLQTRMLEWVAITCSRGSSCPRDQTQVSWIAGRFFLPSEPPGKPPLGWKSRSSDRFDFIYCRWWLQPSVVFWKESYDKPRQHIKKPSHHFANKDPYSQIYGFSNSHVQMW